jgi:hypothetical protein
LQPFAALATFDSIFLILIRISSAGDSHMRRLFLALVLMTGLMVLSSALAAPHPFHDDGGTVNWRLSYPAALQQAQLSGKPIFVLGIFEMDDGSKNIATALRENAEIHKLINRYFIPVVINVEKMDPKDNATLFPRDKIGGSRLPFISFFTERGQFVQGTNGGRDKDQLLADVKKVLTDKANAVPAPAEAALAKQVEMLKKALEAKNYKQAGPTFAAIVKVRGYSASKDKAFDLMDDAQFDAVRLLKEAVVLAGMDQYADAKKLIADIPKEYAGLPVAGEVKEHQETLALLESAYQATKDKKGAWQQTALLKLNGVVAKYPDSPYGALVTKRKADLMPPPKK